MLNVIDPFFKISIITPIQGNINKKWIKHLCDIVPKDSEIILIGAYLSLQDLYCDKVIMIKANCNRSEARNIGIRISNGNIIFLLDSDQYPHKDLINEIIELFKMKYEVIKVPEIFIGEDLWSKALALWKRSVQIADKKDSCIPRIYSKRLLKEIGGFDQELNILEDFKLYLNIRKRLPKETWCRLPIYHYEEPNFHTIIRKSNNYFNSLLKSIDKVFIKDIFKKYSTALRSFIQAMSSKEKLLIKVACIAILIFKIIMLYSIIFINTSKRLNHLFKFFKNY